jgi:Glycosyl hydrolase family 12
MCGLARLAGSRARLPRPVLTWASTTLRTTSGANGVATSGSTEIMIWTENFKQVPAGNRVARVGLGGRTYNVWKTSDNHYIALVPTVVMKSGSIDLLAIFKWLMSKGWLPATSTLGQIDSGVEIVSTDGRNATFTFTDFSIQTIEPGCSITSG